MAQFITNLALIFPSKKHTCVYIHFANCGEVVQLLGQPIGSDLDVVTLISKVRYNVVVVQF